MANVTYSNVTITGYNSSPPPDDGTTSNNEVTWSGIKTELGDPLKTALEAIDTNIASAVAQLNACIAVSTESPAFKANKGGIDQADLASGAWTKITFQNEEFDNAGDYDSTTSIWTPTEFGKYLIGGFYILDPDSSGSGIKQHKCSIYKNGVLHRYLQDTGYGNSGDSYPLVSESAGTLVAANGTTDYFEFYVFHQTGRTEQVRGDPEQSGFWGHRVI